MRGRLQRWLGSARSPSTSWSRQGSRVVALPQVPDQQHPVPPREPHDDDEPRDRDVPDGDHEPTLIARSAPHRPKTPNSQITTATITTTLMSCTNFASMYVEPYLLSSPSRTPTATRISTSEIRSIDPPMRRASSSAARDRRDRAAG